MTNLLGTVGSAQTWVSQQWTQRVVQVSVYAAVVFFLLSNYSLIQVVEKSVKSVSGLKLGNEGTLVLHSVIFGLFMYVGTRFILDPILVKAANGVVEGQVGKKLESDVINKAVEDAEEVKEKFSPTILFGHLSLSKYRHCKEANNYLKDLYSNDIDADIVYRLFGGSGGIELEGIIKSFEEKCPEYND